MHREDDSAGETGAEAVSIAGDGAERSGCVDDDRDAVLPLDIFVPGEVNVVAKGGVRHDDGDLVMVLL